MRGHTRALLWHCTHWEDPAPHPDQKQGLRAILMLQGRNESENGLQVLKVLLIDFPHAILPQLLHLWKCSQTVYSLQTAPSSDTEILFNFFNLKYNAKLFPFIPFILRKTKTSSPIQRTLLSVSVYTLLSSRIRTSIGSVKLLSLPAVGTILGSLKHFSLPAVALGPPQGQTPFPSSSSSPSLP